MWLWPTDFMCVQENWFKVKQWKIPYQTSVCVITRSYLPHYLSFWKQTLSLRCPTFHYILWSTHWLFPDLKYEVSALKVINMYVYVLYSYKSLTKASIYNYILLHSCGETLEQIIFKRSYQIKHNVFLERNLSHQVISE